MNNAKVGYVEFSGMVKAMSSCVLSEINAVPEFQVTYESPEVNNIELYTKTYQGIVGFTAKMIELQFNTVVGITSHATKIVSMETPPHLEKYSADKVQSVIPLKQVVYEMYTAFIESVIGHYSSTLNCNDSVIPLGSSAWYDMVDDIISVVNLTGRILVHGLTGTDVLTKKTYC